MIELQGITRIYEMGESQVRALDNVDLSIPAGDYVAVMGPSGSGKSTLLNILGCLDRPTSGSYRLAGEEVARLDEAALTLVRRNRIGFIFQAFHLVPRLSASANVELPMIFAGIEPGIRREKVAQALNSVGLMSRAHHRPEQLSGGERQRVAIARSVVMGPSILLADEPTGNLDTHSGIEVVGLLERMNAEGLTLIVVTHDPGLGKRARRVIRLEDGRVKPDGTGPSTANAAAGSREPP